MKRFVLMIILLTYFQHSKAKLICLGDCQTAVKSQRRQDSKSSESAPRNEISKKSKIHQEMPQFEKKVGKKYIQKKFFSNSSAQIPNGTSFEFNEIDSNLPNYFSNLNSNSPENVFFIVPKFDTKKKLEGLVSGSVLEVLVQQDIVASSRVPTPIVGLVVSGLYRNSRVYGEAILDEELKRILFNFKTISGGSIANEYVLKAAGLDVLGRIGMTGNYHADDITFGIASFFATATAIAADSQVERSKNAQGEYVENPSAENASKKGIAGAIGKVAERLSNRAMNAPGRTEVEGPLLLRVILDEAPYLKK